eukprot:CAMPEP_0115018730 /NCGR_PEP_ID=MMETSP0216-20121206/29010_1 /TAXON_ID=223996 /ORGANISM="Protocruzia adherens, Strain Boccale" /LENGTH=328 /DNA_ID=CAMNT_0002390041 /DNA_START=120 /DNA_END=1106 /DNA_ORIENTATION=+
MVSASTPMVEPPTTLGKALVNEKVRYQRKGFGICFAALIAWAWFFVLPQYLKGPWEYIITNFSDYVSRGLVGLLVHKFASIIAAITFVIIYKMELPFFERYKTNDNPWPWNEDYEKWRAMLRKTIPQLLINYFVFGPFIQVPLMLKIYSGDLSGMNRVDMDSWPSPWEIMWQTVFCMVVEDLMFYWAHRTLHKPRFYWIHKRHHEYNTTVTIAAEYAHPIEHFFGNTLPVVAGFTILGPKCHAITAHLFLAVRMFETYEGHSGYDFSWSPFRLLPFSGGQEYHDYHHSHNIGNYASFFTYWDSLFGTNKTFYRYLNKRLESQKAKKTD